MQGFICIVYHVAEKIKSMQFVLRNFVLIYFVTISNLDSSLTFKIADIATMCYFTCLLQSIKVRRVSALFLVYMVVIAYEYLIYPLASRSTQSLVV